MNWEGFAFPKGPSKLQRKIEADRDERKLEAEWKRDIWKRDKGCCRWCERPVRKSLELCPDRGECHHVSGRTVKAIRWDRRNGLLLCATCHERVTGTVGDKALVVSSKTYTVDGISYVNADYPVRFKRV